MSDTLLISFASLLVADAGDERLVRGIAVPFGVDSSPHTWQGRAAPHRFKAGSFTRTIAERGHKVRLYSEHDTTALPIGRAVELREQTDGLHAVFELAATSRGDEARELVRSGMVSGLSASIVPLKWREGGGAVEHTEVRLREVSIVAEPAFAAAQLYAAEPAPVLTADAARRRLSLLERTLLP